MRYTEQIKYSWNYYWGVLCELWDMFTLHNWHWFIVGLLMVLCLVPVLVNALFPIAYWYAINSLPHFAPAPLQDIIPDYYWAARGSPPSLLVFNYYWMTGIRFKPLSNALYFVSAGLLLAAYLREK